MNKVIFTDIYAQLDIGRKIDLNEVSKIMKRIHEEIKNTIEINDDNFYSMHELLHNMRMISYHIEILEADE